MIFPAQKKRLIGSKTKGIKRFIIPLLILVLILFISYFKMSSGFFVDDSKLSIAVAGKDGDIYLFVLDRDSHEMTRILLPGDTLVRVAQGYGDFRLKQVNKLAESKGIDKSIIAKTISKNFKFPVYVWGEDNLMPLLEGEIVKALRAFISPKLTNLTFKDKLTIMIFSFLTPTSNRLEIDLTQSLYLIQDTLPDGEKGYLIKKDKPPLKILSIFSDELFFEKNSRISIVALKKDILLEDVVAILETLGSKVVSIEKEEFELENCEVTGTNEKAVKKLARIFGCDISFDKHDQDSEIHLRLGERFNEYF